MAQSVHGTIGPVLLFRLRDFRGGVEYRTYRQDLDIPGALLYHFRLISQSPPRWEFVPVGRAVAPPRRRDRRRRGRPSHFMRAGQNDEAAWVPAPWPFPAGARIHVLRLDVDAQGDVVERYEPHVIEAADLATTGA